MIIGVDYYETDKADVRDYKTWNTSCIFRWIYGCVLLHTEGSGFCKCPDRKHVAVWCKFVRGKSQGSASLLLPGFCFCNRNCHSRACSCQRKRPFTLETGGCFI